MAKPGGTRKADRKDGSNGKVNPKGNGNTAPEYGTNGAVGKHDNSRITIVSSGR